MRSPGLSVDGDDDSPDSAAVDEAGVLGDMLVRLAGERSQLVMLVGGDIGPAYSFAETWPERLVAIGPVRTRMTVAAGIVGGGGDAIVVMGQQDQEVSLGPQSGVVLLSEDPGHLGMAYRHRFEVCQPAWPQDLTALMIGALGTSATTLLMAPPAATRDSVPPPPTSIDADRIFRQGADGVVIGSGRTAPISRDLGQALARRQVMVTAMEIHTIRPQTGIDPAMLIDHVLAGPLDSPRAEAMTAVPVEGDLDQIAARVHEALGTTIRARR